MIPSKEKYINETLALELLKMYSEKYHFYERIQKDSFPDLYYDKSRSAVEVTSDLPSECWKRIMQKVPFTLKEWLMPSKCTQRTEKPSALFTRDDRNDTKKAIDQKLRKQYKDINELELFLFTYHIDFENFLDTIFNYVVDQQINAQQKISRLFIFSDCKRLLWILDFSTKNILTHSYSEEWYMNKKNNIAETYNQ